MTTRLYRIHSRLYQILTLLLKVINTLVRWCLWDDAYGMMHCRNVIMQCRQILVDWARMCNTRNNLRMTWSNDKSPKLLSEKLSTIKGKKSVIKAIWFKFLLGNVITTKSHHREDSMVGCKIMSRCIVFGSPIANLYAQSSSITSEHEKSDNDINSDLTANNNR
jgi:hypothetical protein